MSEKTRTFDLEQAISLELLNCMPTPVVILGEDERVLMVNKAMEALTGYSMAEVRGTVFSATMVPERERIKEKEIVNSLARIQQPTSHKCMIRKKDGSEEIHDWTAACFTDASGRTSAIALFGHWGQGGDAGDEHLRVTGKLLESALDGTNVDVIVIDRGWRVFHLSERLKAGFQDALGKPCYQVMAAGRAPCDQCPAGRVFESETDYREGRRESLAQRVVLEAPRQAGETSCGRGTLVSLPVSDTTGGLLGAVVLAASSGRDRRLGGESLTANETLNALLSQSLDGVIIADVLTGSIVEANRRARDMLGASKDSLVGTPASELFPPEWRTEYERLLNKTLPNNSDYFQINALMGKQGTRRVAVELLACLVDTDGTKQVHMVFRDVSRERRIQGQLKSQASLLQNVNDAIISVDMNETVLFLNKKAESTYGLKAEDAICRSLYEVVRYEFVNESGEQEFRSTIEKDSFWRGEVIHHNKDGTPINIDASVSVVSDDKGRPTGLVMVNRDITSRKAAEKKLKRRGDEMAALYEIGQAISTHLNLKDVLSVIHTQVGRLMCSRNFYIALYDEEKQEVFFPIYVDELVRKDGTSRRARKGYTEYVIHTGTPVLLSKAAEEKMASEGYQGVGPQALSWLGVPLRSGQKIIGMMAVQSYTKSEQYDEDDVRILSAISDQAAIAIENARMFERVRSSEETYRSLVESMEKNLPAPARTCENCRANAARPDSALPDR